MKKIYGMAAIVVLAGLCHAAEPVVQTPYAANPAYWSWAKTPPMGWNSWDCFGTTLTEEQAKAQADAMEKYLKPYGWTYFTVDIQWYEPDSQGHSYRRGARLEMDEYSRLIPALKKFPSSSNGRGFKPLADYVHAKGLKFGIHIMRGIPKQAVRDNTAILGTDARAADIANTRSTCPWNPDMYGVDMSKSGAQAYYDSLFELYASWGVDFVKVDDIARPYDEVQKAEIEAIRKAIDKTGRPIVLSLSPGDTPIQRGQHVMNHANMWRISDDFWDRWQPLYEMFGRLEKWTQYRAEGAWPDADMLPFGIVEFNRPTRFTPAEQTTCMTLWCIARSPLILGADMTRLDNATLDLLTNPEVLAVNQASTNNRQIKNENDLIVWAADSPDGRDRYVGLFNAQSNDNPFDLSKPDFTSRRLSGQPKAQVIEISIPTHNARRLVLAVRDGGNGSDYDHAAWIEPVLTGPKGTLKLTDLDWILATAGWGTVHKHRTVDGRPLTLDGKPVEGIGTHAVSVIEFELPEGYDTFASKGVITEGSQGRGALEFCVLLDPQKRLKSDRSTVSVSFADLGIAGKARVRDLWARRDLGEFSEVFQTDVPLHGAGLFRISPMP
ncbi:NPCBM/NEW2 domain-containing protein [Anaerohalosphaeraceae bacterium U12dextr]